jgi:flagellar biogenesis protein FliO
MNVREVYSRLSFQRSTLRASLVFKRIGRWIKVKREQQIRSQRLRVAEKVTVGEKSTVSVVHVDGRRFLLASGQTCVSLIAELSPEESFSAAVRGALVMDQQGIDSPRPKRQRANKVVKEDVAA